MPGGMSNMQAFLTKTYTAEALLTALSSALTGKILRNLREQERISYIYVRLVYFF
jgi:hypothetical protein